MRKALYLLLIFSLSMGFVSCGSDDDNDLGALKGEWIYKQTTNGVQTTSTINFHNNSCTITTTQKGEGVYIETKIIYNYEYLEPNIKFYTSDTNEYVSSGIVKDNNIVFYDKENNKTVYKKK